MRNSILICALAFTLFVSGKDTTAMAADLKDFKSEKIDLKLPLLVIKGLKGFLACGYINVETCNKTKEVCAIVTGVKTHEDMLKAEIKSVSDEAKNLGIKVGMKGDEALDLLK